MLSGDFSARLPATEDDNPADDAMRRLNLYATQMQRTIQEITRLSSELNQGKFGGQAEVVVSIRQGPWRQCLEAFNMMEWTLTGQIRDFAKTASRLAAGRFDHPPTVQCQGEMLGLKDSLTALVERMKT
jgi:methyl-accepting chemotaxis protein